MNVGTRRRRGAPSRDTLADMRATIAVNTGGLEPGGLRPDFASLAEDEQRRVVELVREAGEGRSFSFSKLSDRKLRELEGLIERAADAPGIFENTRSMEEIRRLASEAHVAAVRRPLSRGQETGIFLELARCVERGWLHAPHVALLSLLLTAVVSGRPLGPRSRIERLADGETALVVDATYGPFSGDFDPESELSARFQTNLNHLASNDWVTVKKNGREWWITPGLRLRTIMEGRPVKDAVRA